MKYQNDGGVKKRGKLPPLRTLAELAVELNVNARTLQSKLARMADAPKPVINGRGFAVRATYYEPRAFRKWWRSLASN